MKNKMIDRSYCTNDKCPKAESCLRHELPGHTKMCSYSDFRCFEEGFDNYYIPIMKEADKV